MKIDGIEKFMSIGKENADAVMKSGTATIKGFEQLTLASQALAMRSAEKADAAAKALLAVKTPADFADVQNRLTREAIETAILEGRKFAEIAVAAYASALEPWNARLAQWVTPKSAA